MKWSNIDFKLKTMTIEDTKNKQQYVLPLSDFLFTLLTKRNQTGKAVSVFARARSKTGYIHYPKRQLAKVTEKVALSLPHTIYAGLLQQLQNG